MIEAARQQARDAQRIQQEGDFELFADNLPAFTVFQRMATQWRSRGMDGEWCGLEYTSLPAVMRYSGIKPGDRAQIFEDVQIMERETLKVIAENRA